MGVKAKCGQKSLDSRCAVCQSEEDTTEHVLKCNKGYKKFDLNDEGGKEWGGGGGEIYRKKKENRSINNIEAEQNILGEQKKREDSRRRQNLREDKTYIYYIYI